MQDKFISVLIIILKILSSNKTCTISENFKLLNNRASCSLMTQHTVKLSTPSCIKCILSCMQSTQMCVRISYMVQGRICVLFPSRFPVDNLLDLRDGKCLNFQRREQKCSQGFERLEDDQLCLQLVVGAWNWSEARKVCNGIHRSSHPITLTNSEKKQAVIGYLNSLLGLDKTACIRANPIRMPLWTAGQRSQSSTLFQWKPFTNSSTEFTDENLWYEGKPDPGSNEVCVNLWYDAALNDEDCSIKYCVLCEEDQL